MRPPFRFPNCKVSVPISQKPCNPHTTTTLQNTCTASFLYVLQGRPLSNFGGRAYRAGCVLLRPPNTPIRASDVIGGHILLITKDRNRITVVIHRDERHFSFCYVDDLIRVAAAVGTDAHMNP